MNPLPKRARGLIRSQDEDKTLDLSNLKRFKWLEKGFNFAPPLNVSLWRELRKIFNGRPFFHSTKSDGASAAHAKPDWRVL